MKIPNILKLCIIFIVLLAVPVVAETTVEDIDMLLGATDTLRTNIMLDQFEDPTTTPEDLEGLELAGDLEEGQQEVVDSKKESAGVDADKTKKTIDEDDSIGDKILTETLTKPMNIGLLGVVVILLIVLLMAGRKLRKGNLGHAKIKGATPEERADINKAKKTVFDQEKIQRKEFKLMHEKGRQIHQNVEDAKLLIKETSVDEARNTVVFKQNEYHSFIAVARKRLPKDILSLKKAKLEALLADDYTKKDLMNEHIFSENIDQRTKDFIEFILLLKEALKKQGKNPAHVPIDDPSEFKMEIEHLALESIKDEIVHRLLRLREILSKIMDKLEDELALINGEITREADTEIAYMMNQILRMLEQQQEAVRHCNQMLKAIKDAPNQQARNDEARKYALTAEELKTLAINEKTEREKIIEKRRSASPTIPKPAQYSEKDRKVIEAATLLEIDELKNDPHKLNHDYMEFVNEAVEKKKKDIIKEVEDETGVKPSDKELYDLLREKGFMGARDELIRQIDERSRNEALADYKKN